MNSGMTRKQFLQTALWGGVSALRGAARARRMAGLGAAARRGDQERTRHRRHRPRGVRGGDRYPRWRHRRHRRHSRQCGAAGDRRQGSVRLPGLHRSARARRDPDGRRPGAREIRAPGRHHAGQRQLRTLGHAVSREDGARILVSRSADLQEAQPDEGGLGGRGRLRKGHRRHRRDHQQRGPPRLRRHSLGRHARRPRSPANRRRMEGDRAARRAWASSRAPSACRPDSPIARASTPRPTN